MNDTAISKKWSLSTGLAFWGVTIQTLFNFIGLCFILYVAYNLTDIAISGFLPSVASMSLDYYEDRMMGLIIVVIVCAMIAFLGYLVYLGGICLFKGAQRSVDSEAHARSIMLVELLLPVFSILYVVIQVNCYKTIYSNFTTLISYSVLPFIVMFVSIIILLVQYGALSKENTWSEKARGGAGDVKTSYACLLWMLLAIIIGIGMVALTLFSFYSKLDSLKYSGDGYSGMFDGINAMSKMVNDLAHTVKAEVLFTEIMILTLSVWSTIKRIVGWRMIHNGGSEEIYQLASKQSAYAGTGRFCHKCGMQLPEGSAFCPGCGSAVVGVTVETMDTQEPDDSIAPDEAPRSESLSSEIRIEYEDEDADKKKKWMLYGGIAAGVIAVAAVVWAFGGGSDKLEPNANVFAEHSVIFKSIEDGVGIEALANVEYGTEIESMGTEYDDTGTWIKVAFEKDGKVTTGYIAKADILTPDDFLLVNNAGMHDSNLRAGMPANIERLALLHALRSNGGNWSLEKLGRDGQKGPNSKRLIVRGVSPSEDCLGFILRNNNTNERLMLLYSTPDLYSVINTKEPVYLYSEPIIGNWDEIYDVTYRKRGKRYEVIYMTVTEETYHPGSFMYEGSAVEEEPEQETDKVWWGTIELNGKVDGKYPVRMVLIMHDGGSVSGTITYLKYNVPMELSGSFTNAGDYRDLALDEKSDGKVTGNFIGRYDGKVFAGAWVSADGAKEMPFSVAR